MARHVLHGHGEFEEFLHARMTEVASGGTELTLEGVIGTFVFPSADEFGDAVESVRVEVEGLADLACGGASAIGDDVGGHGGAEFSVMLVDVLNDTLALVAAGKIKVDVGPLAALFAEEALEKQVHADGIYGGDAERIADGTVSGGTTSLGE